MSRLGTFRRLGPFVAFGILFGLFNLGFAACKEPVRSGRPPARKDAAARTPRVAPPQVVPQAPPATAAQRRFDQANRDKLQPLVKSLNEAFQRLLGLARRGAAEPTFRNEWPAKRDAFIAEVGRLRAKVLAVDPLAKKSWAVPEALRLCRYLSVQLPDAIGESWSSRPSGALQTWRADFRSIWRRLKRYVESLKNESG
jgi:hypothetical protein